MKSEILGTDCVFGMISLESVCNELEAFFQWSYDSCQTKGPSFEKHFLDSKLVDFELT